ncbi:MAG: SAM-dependent methyltransferase, partial [Bacteroidota bacterium]|nr:SAM-dependent methyltransferase [Bacteroidota bacterium]
MSSLFKRVLNSVPRPLLIRLSYIARPFLAFSLRGDTYQ